MNPIEKAAPGLMYGGGTGAFLFGLDANTVGMLAGVVIGVIGLLLTWHYSRKRDKREQEEHDLRMGRKP
jgi:Na+/glutamate symporter